MSEKRIDSIDHLEIEPLSDDALELVAGGKSSDGDACCSCEQCSNGGDGGDDGDIKVEVPIG
jgi:hypothetical protein